MFAFSLLISGNNIFPYIPEKKPGIRISGIAYPFSIPYSIEIDVESYPYLNKRMVNMIGSKK